MECTWACHFFYFYLFLFHLCYFCTVPISVDSNMVLIILSMKKKKNPIYYIGLSPRAPRLMSHRFKEKYFSAAPLPKNFSIFLSWWRGGIEVTERITDKLCEILHFLCCFALTCLAVCDISCLCHPVEGESNTCIASIL